MCHQCVFDDNGCINLHGVLRPQFTLPAKRWRKPRIWHRGLTIAHDAVLDTLLSSNRKNCTDTVN